jgi:peptidoglycan/xylan/chitin deacetylase (PgdA/CDA1 family)
MHWNARNIAAWLISSYYLFTGRHKRVIRDTQAGKYIISVYFHNPSRSQFRCCVTWFQKQGFQFLSVNDLIEIIAQKKPFPKQAVLITADDSWKENLTNIVDVSNELNVPITIFATLEPIMNEEGYWWSYIEKANKQGVITETVNDLKKVSNLERLKLLNIAKSTVNINREALTQTEVQAIDKSKFVQFGSHTITHPILTQCDDDKSQQEIEQSKQQLEAWLNREVNSFAYPNGSYTAREIRFLKEAGYKVAFNTKPSPLSPKYLESPFEIPRFDILENVSMNENICRMIGLWFERKK